MHEPKSVYKFCPRCKSEFNKENELLKCNNCGLKYFLNPIPAVLALIFLKNSPEKVLLVRRSREPTKDLLDLPGGFLSEDETFEQGIQRELKEELNLKLTQKNLSYLTSFKDRYLFEDINYYVSTIVFTYKIDEEIKLKPSDDANEYSYVNIYNLKDKELSFKELNNILSIYKSKML